MNDAIAYAEQMIAKYSAERAQADSFEAHAKASLSLAFWQRNLEANLRDAEG